VKVNVPLYQIGEVAERVGLSLRTVRYYEERGLLVPETRSEGGFRMYSDDQVDRLALIKRMKPLGFTVQQTRVLLDARRTLADESASVDLKEAARASLQGFAKAAAERCEQLRDRLDEAAAFADQVRRESQRVRCDESFATGP
jgi:DNA-binding transcriptional MerR regulator